ncbi:uncharacterized protein A4U43_C09F1720 [Asparagus officinalis]|uniref:TFIIS N-terminal domain-containing protein n=1 Tax=Asparagus officinalis TaxID=4686 RepID=A0A5P1E7T8_ASPOF|nr:probable mediator of RNA polymerase II transcription subunit 26c [Asparagus officinalis]XP_020246189.1 probable mediator of RNA polymerase II transcription subunit 26c [Asparagus officinalis]ONK57557.1 uncharacterized protein A4U43_C09F1720 [Asparagus officinalis]
MDRDDLRSILRTTGVDLWTLIETAISVAASDHGPELRLRRDRFVEKLYAPPPQDLCRISDERVEIEAFEAEKLRSRAREEKGSSSPIEKVFGSSPLTPQSNQREEGVGDEEDEDVDIEDDDDRRCYEDPIDREKRKILAIKEELEDPDQSDDSVAGLLQSLADMDITFKALKETDIGRHVNGLRKHSSNEVRRLVKQLVRKWKEIVDEWVKANSDNASPAIITDGESPQQIPAKSSQNGHQVPEFAYSPNIQNGRTSSRSSLEVEPKPKVVPKREAPSRPMHSTPSSASPAKLKEQKDSMLDDRLANARKRLQANYQEAQNAKKQRTIQVMDIHEIPKQKNTFIARNKGGQHQQKHYW